MTTIITKNGTGVPANSSLATGELAVDTTNKRIYTSSDGTNVSEVGTNPSTLTVDTDTLVVDAANNRVGVGIASPSGKAHVYEGASGATANTSADTLVLENSDQGGVSILTPNASTGNIFFGDAASATVGRLRYDHSVNAMTFFTDNAERMRIDSSGRVGIGTNSPYAGISVEKSGGFSSATQYYLPSGNVYVAAQGVSAQDNWIGIKGNYNQSSGSANLLLQANFQDTGGQGAGNYIASEATGAGESAITFGRLVSGANSSTAASKQERMRIAANGNVGIGTSSPDYKLDVSTTSATTYSSTTTQDPTAIIQNTSGTTGSYAAIRIQSLNGNGGTPSSFSEIVNESTSGNFRSNMLFKTKNASNASVERMRIDSSGNVGIGTNTFTGTGLNVVGGVSGTIGDGAGIFLGSGSSSSDPNLRGAWLKAINTSGSNNAHALSFATNAGSSAPTEHMRIDSSGNLLVNTTTGTSAFTLKGRSTVGFYAQIVQSDSTAVQTHYMIGFKKGDGTTIGSITHNGANTTSFNTSSDYRLKENVVTLDNATDRLKQIPVHRFNFTSDPDTIVDGFLAHEVQDVVPEAITGTKDAVDDEGNPVYQGIDQSKLVPLLTAALQEAVTRIETLEAEVTALKGA